LIVRHAGQHAPDRTDRESRKVYRTVKVPAFGAAVWKGRVGGMSESKDIERLAELRALYPMLSDDELRMADDRLARYVALALRVFERLEREHENAAAGEELTVPGTEVGSDAKGRIPAP
jgi:hypothetical protein